MKQGPNYYFYHNDHLGTPQKMTTTSGAIVWSVKYTSFGKATVHSGSTVANPLRLSGQYEDAETELHYNLHRHYDPNLGRYLRSDPIGLAGGLNLHTYVANNPANLIDPYGLWWAWLYRVLTPYARYLPFLPAAQKVAEDILVPGPGVYSSYEELKKRYKEKKAKKLYALYQTITFEEQFYLNELNECLADTQCEKKRKQCLQDYYDKYNKYISPLKIRLYELTPKES